MRLIQLVSLASALLLSKHVAYAQGEFSRLVTKDVADLFPQWRRPVDLRRVERYARQASAVRSMATVVRRRSSV